MAKMLGFGRPTGAVMQACYVVPDLARAARAVPCAVDRQRTAAALDRDPPRRHDEPASRRVGQHAADARHLAVAEDRMDFQLLLRGLGGRRHTAAQDGGQRERAGGTEIRMEHGFTESAYLTVYGGNRQDMRESASRDCRDGVMRSA